MDTRKFDRALDPTWRRWVLLIALLAIGALYIFAFVFFKIHSENFIDVQHNRRAAEFSRRHTSTVPSKFVLQSGQSDAARLGGGWYAPDPQGTWTATRDAWIELTLAPRPTDFILHMDVTLFVAKRRPTMKFTVDVNDTELGSWSRTISNNSEAIEVRVPASLIRERDMEIHIHTDEVDSPLHLHVGDDGRKIGLMLSSIELRNVNDESTRK